MSRIERIATKQGHPVPDKAGPTRGPFPAELFRSSPVITNYESKTGNGGPEIPDEGTAQNNYRPHRLFKCKLCADLVKEPDLKNHVCLSKEGTNEYGD